MARRGKDHGLDPAGPRLDHHRISDARHPEGVLDVLGVHVEAVRQHDHVLRPAHQDQPAGLVQPPDVARPVPAVRRERRGGRVGVLPVALEQGRAGELDLAVLGQAHPDRWHRSAHGAGLVVRDRLAGTEPGFRRAIALDHDDAHVLPRLLDGRWQEGARGDEQAEAAAQPRVDGTEEPAPGGVGEPPGNPSKAVECRRSPGLFDLPLDGRPEEFEDLRNDHHGCGAVIADCLEDRARVATADIQDARADVERVEQRDRLLEQVREGQ